MDYDYLDSEATETLDFLTPPVQRVRNYRERIVATDFNNPTNNIYLLRDFRTKITQKTQYPELESTIINSSTSLILKKTTKRELRQQYSILDYTYLQHSGNQKSNQSQIENIQQGCSTRQKPIIRITVIPNEKHKSKTVHNKRKHSKVKVQSSVSNQESSIKAKNVYLVVSGKRTEKIYEVKTTGSAEFANQPHYIKKDEDIHVEPQSSFKRLIKSLDMDKKKRKSKQMEVTRMHSNSSLVNDIFGGPDKLLLERNCIDNDKDSKNRKSRVRLTGRIGLTGDEKYVLNCAATIDDRPVETNFIQQSSYKTQSTLNDQEFQNCRCQKDSKVQADFPIEDPCCRSIMMNALRCKETQCSPASFNTVCFKNIDKLKIFTNKDQTIQCNCDDFFKQTTNAVDNNNTFNTLNTNPSPLVIISVYTKPDLSEESSEKIETNQVNKENKTRFSQQKTNVFNVNTKQQISSAKQKADNSLNKSVSKPARARSPSPSKSHSKQKVENNQNQTKASSRKSAKTESNPQSSTSTINKQKKGKTTKEVKYKSFQQKQSKTNSKKQQNLKVEGAKLQTAKAINKDHTLTKKALVDSFSKKVVERMNERGACKMWRPPKNDMSNVSVNIDGNREYYDVLFRRGDLTTDLQVRRTLKEKESQKNYGDDDASLENFLLLEEGKPRRRSFSQTYLENDQPNDAPVLLKPLSRITLRDSIEISQRRDEALSIFSAKIPHKKFSPDSNSNDSMYYETCIKLKPPVKHFRGDSCAVPNPLQRDREVRELLGVNKGRQNVPSSKIKEEPDATSQGFLHCCYKTRRSNQNRLLQKLDSTCSFFKLFPPSFCFENEEGEQTENRNLDQTGHFKTDCTPYEESIKDNIGCYCPGNEEELQTEIKDFEQARQFTKKSEKYNVDKSSKFKVKSGAATQSDPNETKHSDPLTQKYSFSLCISRKPKARPSELDSNPTDESGPQTKKHVASSKTKLKPKTSPSELNSNDETDQLKKKVSKSRNSIQTKTRDLEQAMPFKKSSSSPKKSKTRNVKCECPVNEEDLKTETRDLKQATLIKKESMSINVNKSCKPKVKSGAPVMSDSSRKTKHKLKTSESESNSTEKSDSEKKKMSKSCKSKHKLKTSESDSNPTEESDSEQPKVSKSKNSKSKSKTQNVECELPVNEQDLKTDTPDLEQARQLMNESNKINLDKSRKCKVKSGAYVKSETNAAENSDPRTPHKLKERHPQSDLNPTKESGLETQKRLTKSPKSKHKIKTSKCDLYQTEESDSEQKKVSKSRKSKPRPKTTQLESNLTFETTQIKERVKKSRKSKSKLKTSQTESSTTGEESDHQLNEPASKSRNSDSLTKLSDNLELQWTKCLNYKSETTQCECQPPLYQQLFLNRNINIYLQIEQFTKKKPIVLTRKQYDKVKRTIENASLKRPKMTICKRNSSVSIGEVRRKHCFGFHFDRKVQTDTIFNKWVAKAPRTPIVKPRPSVCDIKVNKSNQFCEHCECKLQSCCCPKQKFVCKPYRKEERSVLRREQYYCGMVQSKTLVMFGDQVDLGHADPDKNKTNEKDDAPKHTASSMELRHANVGYLKRILFTSTDVAQNVECPSATKVDYHSDSVHTIFKGHRKTPTPNFGTSVYSLYSDYSIPESPKVVAAKESKQRKPFLRRLMSCLVMRSRTSELKIPEPKITDFNTSIDSYHISTSLGAIELSSSIYDTSDSFYSNHTIGPINSKMKRGFFSSMRGFLNRKS